MVFEHSVPLRYYAGHFRSIDPHKPCLARNVSVGTVSGFAADIVVQAMMDFSTKLATEEAVLSGHIALQVDPGRIAMAKLQFVAGALGLFIKIHPFINGNGRISRLIANYLCFRHNLPMPFVDPSNRPPENEYWQSMSLAMQGNPNYLFQYLFRAVAARLTSGTSDEARLLAAI